MPTITTANSRVPEVEIALGLPAYPTGGLLIDLSLTAYRPMAEAVGAAFRPASFFWSSMPRYYPNPLSARATPNS